MTNSRVSDLPTQLNRTKSDELDNLFVNRNIPFPLGKDRNSGLKKRVSIIKKEPVPDAEERLNLLGEITRQKCILRSLRGCGVNSTSSGRKHQGGGKGLTSRRNLLNIGQMSGEGRRESDERRGKTVVGWLPRTIRRAHGQHA